MGLEDTQDFVFVAMLARAKHLALLEVHLYRGIQGPALVFAQSVKAARDLACGDACQRKDVLVQTTEHPSDGFLHQFAGLLLYLHQISVSVPRLTIVCTGNWDTGMPADTADEAVNDTASVIDDVHVYRIVYLDIGTGGIYLRHALVLTSLAVREGCRILVPDGTNRRFLTAIPCFVPLMPVHTFLLSSTHDSKEFSHLVGVIITDALAQGDEMGGGKYRLVGKLPKATEVLHVGTLLNHSDGVLVGQTDDMLNNHGICHHAGLLGTSSCRLVVECLTIQYDDLRQHIKDYTGKRHSKL